MLSSKKLVAIIASVIVIVVIMGMLKRRVVPEQVPKRSQQISGDYPNALTSSAIEKQHKGIKCQKNPRLSSEIIKNVKVFLLFIGYPRSGHSIVASVLDAHPHIVVSSELQIMSKVNAGTYSLKDAHSLTTRLYRDIYNLSKKNAMPGGVRMNERKGYSLAIEKSCQGSFKHHIHVIGDKSGGGTVAAYNQNKLKFVSNYEKLKELLNIPIKVLHIVRNPYDNIATKYLYSLKRSASYGEQYTFVRKVKENGEAMIPNVNRLERVIMGHFAGVQGISELKKIIGRANVLDIHQTDFVHHPKEIILGMTKFLGVEAEEDYLQLCIKKIFPEVHHSRNLLVWPEELKSLIQQNVEKYEFLQGYSFASD